MKYTFLTERLSEQLNESLSTAKKEFIAKGYDSKEIENIAKKYDPSGNKFTFIHNIMRWYDNDKSIDLDEVKQTILYFDLYLNKGFYNKKVVNKNSRNMIADMPNKNSFATFEDFKTFYKENFGIRFTDTIAKNNRIKFITENDEYYVIIPTDYTDFKSFGKSTDWCVSMRDDKQYYDQYVLEERNTFYFIISKTKPDKKGKDNKFAVAVNSSGGYRDVRDFYDDSITVQEIEKITGISPDIYKYDFNPMNIYLPENKNNEDYEILEIYYSESDLSEYIDDIDKKMYTEYKKQSKKLTEVEFILNNFGVNYDSFLNYSEPDVKYNVDTGIYDDEPEEYDGVEYVRETIDITIDANYYIFNYLLNPEDLESEIQCDFIAYSKYNTDNFVIQTGDYDGPIYKTPFIETPKWFLILGGTKSKTSEESSNVLVLNNTMSSLETNKTGTIFLLNSDINNLNIDDSCDEIYIYGKCNITNLKSKSKMQCYIFSDDINDNTDVIDKLKSSVSKFNIMGKVSPGVNLDDIFGRGKYEVMFN